jgi:hypothetical protein
MRHWFSWSKVLEGPVWRKFFACLSRRSINQTPELSTQGRFSSNYCFSIVGTKDGRRFGPYTVTQKWNSKKKHSIFRKHDVMLVWSMWIETSTGVSELCFSARCRRQGYTCRC